MSGPGLELEKIFEPLSCAVLCVDGARICYANSAARRLLGVIPDNAAELLPEEVLRMGDGACAAAAPAGIELSLRAASAGGVRVFYLERAVRGGSELVPPDAAARSRLLSALNRAVWSSVQLAQQSDGGRRGDSDAGIRRVIHSVALLERMLLDRIRLEGMQNREIPLNLGTHSASRLCGELSRTLDYLAKPRGITVRFGGGEGVNGRFDPYWAEVALLHLADNALRAMENGGTLTLRAENTESATVFAVDDDGAGLDSETLAGMFSGDTVGLPLVKAIAAAHGGVCVGWGAPGEGAHFRLSLPLTAGGEELNSATVEYGGGMRLVLTELADWLRDEDYDPRLMD